MIAKPRVVVVGGGIAGLTAAFRLKRAGSEVTVLEKGPQEIVGGRMATVQHQGFAVDTGATLLTTKYREMLALIADAGLMGEIVPANDIFGMVRSGGVDRQHMGSRGRLLNGFIRNPLPKLDLLKLARDFMRINPLIKPHDMSRAAAQDFESVTQYVRSRGLRPMTLDYFLEPLAKSLCLGEPEDLSIIAAFTFLKVMFTPGGFFTSPGGVGFLTQGLAGLLNIEYKAQVTSVETHGSQVTVTWSRAGESEHLITADACVLAAPPPQLVPLYGQLTAEQKQYLSDVSYSCSIHVALGLDRPTAEPSVLLQIPRVEHPDLMAFVLEHNQAPERVPRGKGLMMAHTTNSWSARNWELDDAKIVDYILGANRQLKLLPELDHHLTTALVCRASPGLVLRRPGDYRAIARFASTLHSDARVQLAGSDYLGHSSTNSAVCSGERAAARIAALLRTEGFSSHTSNQPSRIDSKARIPA